MAHPAFSLAYRLEGYTYKEYVMSSWISRLTETQSNALGRGGSKTSVADQERQVVEFWFPLDAAMRQTANDNDENANDNDEE
jgi:hypothetical protein